MFYLDVSKVDLDVAHVEVATCACFKCFIYFGLMLQMFHLDVLKVDQVLQATVHLLLRGATMVHVPTPKTGK